ncbi:MULTISPECIES: GNAT family N-acetyltransferase [Pseudonocardia]|uniref:Lysine N-acyltransferase MbtK n=2 Tax=Pseudonocardia TaxID=1847 RepID=A0A1Y2MZL5_PSEAH|nr:MULTISPECIES: GNAT family N-acetyltransferase [Pseudonocardia]OSY40615.1 Lysine N-acyltransferase MbtK [Pseudonocardia autotrophica]TDN73587.1 RimJ/RimL family protein N-acetyltransferase [Pseudonocardia autotrophica]BBG04331.1 hypothetical protein Pdca_55400 [Pseudonocardia autotrophica]GEC25194.1 hypothetical protein PSA01_22230 [Pseudonocardia saturnea]
MSDPVDRERHRLISDLLLDTGARPVAGPLLVPLPAVGLSLLCEVTHASPAGFPHLARVAVGDTMGHLDRSPDPGELAAALRTELADRWAGGVPVTGGSPVPCSAAGPVGDPPTSVGAALTRLRDTIGAAGDAALTDAVLVRGLLPAALTGTDPGDEAQGLAGLGRELAAARDREPGGPVRELLEGWLTAAHLWRRPALHPMPWHRIPNPLRPAAVVPVTDPPVPVRCDPFTLRPALPHTDDVALVAGWMRTPSVSRFFGQPWPDGRWARELAGHTPGSGTAALLAERTGDPDSEPVGYVELYRPARHPLARSFPTTSDDVGVHVSVAPAEHGRGVGSALLGAVADAVLAAAGPGTRVLAEPDARNTAAQRAFRNAGFRPAEQIALPHKDSVVLVREPGQSR